MDLELRDALAGLALVGLLAGEARTTVGREPWQKELAGDAYRLADAMMAERLKNDKPQGADGGIRDAI